MSANTSRVASTPDSWPPTQMRLRPSTELDHTEVSQLDLSRIDDDPLNYFLTPAPLSDEEDEIFDFDAGIEDAKRPPPIVRSVSPSSLDGLRLPPPRPPTPPRSSSSPELDNPSYPSSDDEDYIKFPSTPTFPVALRDLLSTRERGKDKPMSREANDSTAALLSPASFHVPRTNGNDARGSVQHGPTSTSDGDNGYFRSKPLRLSPHSWRMPSPDVWSIEEESTEDLAHDHEMGGQAVPKGTEDDVIRSQPMDIPVAKPKKRVRFVLPLLED